MPSPSSPSLTETPAAVAEERAVCMCMYMYMYKTGVVACGGVGGVDGGVAEAVSLRQHLAARDASVERRSEAGTSVRESAIAAKHVCSRHGPSGDIIHTAYFILVASNRD